MVDRKRNVAVEARERTVLGNRSKEPALVNWRHNLPNYRENFVKFFSKYAFGAL